MIVEINGQQVELDDSFGSMTPAQQESMINEVASHMGQNTQNQPQRSEPTQSSDSISPVTGAIYGGMIGAIPATAIGATNALGAGAKVLGNAFRDTNIPTPTSTAPTAQAPIPYPEPVQPATVPQAASAAPIATEAEPIVHGGEKWNKKLTGVHVPGSQMAKEDLAIAEQMAKTVGRGGELAGGEIKNGVMRGPKSLAEMKADIVAQQAAEKAKLLHESRIAQAARDAEITNEAQRRAVDYLNSKQVAPKPTAMQRLGQLGEHLTPTGVAGKALNSVAPILSMAGAGAEGVDAYNRFNHGDYGRGVISGLGALGSAASMLPNKYARGLGTAAATAAPVINAGLDKLLGREGYADGGAVQHFDKGGSALEAAAPLIKSGVNEVAPWVKKRMQTVTDPFRMAFPGIYKRPDVIAAEAAARVAPENPALSRLFGVTRDDLYQMGKNRVGNVPGVLPGAAANPKGSASATGVMNKRNANRIVDVLGESEKYPELVKGMDPWYIMDPAFNRLKELVGPEEAIKQYNQLNHLTGMASPGSNVLTEMNRGTAANYLANQGRFDDFLKYAGKSNNPSAPADMQSILGHPYHMTAQGKPMQQYLETGSIQMKSPKVPVYIQSSGVPETGFQTDIPVGDAHWSRAVGLADTRGGESSYGASVSNPEMAQLAPWWRDKIAARVGLESVPAQARAWGAFSPQTGVDSPIGAPKLELLAGKIMETADRMGITPEAARDMVLTGKAYAGKKEGGLAHLKEAA